MPVYNGPTGPPDLKKLLKQALSTKKKPGKDVTPLSKKGFNIDDLIFNGVLSSKQK